MKIAFIDRGAHQFRICDELKRRGTNVTIFNYYTDIKNPEKYDAIIIDGCGADAVSASKIKHKKLIARTLGVEIYESSLGNINWNNIDVFLGLSKHQIDYFKMRFGDEHKPKRLGVLPIIAPLKEFELRKSSTPNNNVAMISNITGRKGSDQIPEFLLKYPQMVIHHLGFPCKYGHPVEEFVRWRLARDGTADRYVHTKYINYPQINHWLEDKTYFWLPSISEGFCRAAIEAMAKGLKPIIRHWAGAETIYPQENLYDTVDDIQRIIDLPYEPKRYRDFVDKRYNVVRVVDELEKYL